MSTTPPPMLPDFPNWCASLGIGDAVDVHQRRWSAIATFAASAKTEAVESLLRLCFQTKQPPDAAIISAIRDAVRETDPPAALPNDHQLRLLAATALVIVMNAGATLGARAALGLTTTAGYGRALPDLPMDLLALADAQLGIIANKTRTRKPLPLVEAAPSIEVETTKAKLSETPWTNTWQGAAEALANLKTPLDNVFQAFVTGQNAIVRSLNQTLAMQDEELNMLWWLTNAYSNDFHTPFRDIAQQRRTLVYAKELADLTAFLPGPASSRALLSRAGLNGGPQTIASLVNEAEATWTRALVAKKAPSPISTPVHFAIARASETGPGTDWIANWNSVTELDANRPIDALTLGTLFYRERLLVRAA